MSDRSTETEQRTPRSRVRSIGAAICLAVAVGFSIAAFAVNASATSPVRAKAQCRINFQASSLHLKVGQDLVLTWAAIGADKLSASWTSGYVPFAGAVTTTMNRSGTFSYQVTGTSGGQYCGGAGVEVSFTGDVPSHTVKTTSAPAVTPSSIGTAGGSNGGSNNGANTNGGAKAGVGGANAARPGAANYPAQSPTGGSGVAWFEQPLNLSGIAALAMLCSLLLWKREQVRAPFVHRH